MSAAAQANETLLWDDRLIQKYNVAGPRYTSYPPANHFSDDFSTEAYKEILQRSQDSIAPLSLYVHLPFCENICYYCACNKVVTRKREPLRNYLAALEHEIRHYRQLMGRSRPVQQLHWGGGTPTFLSPAEMTELMHYLALNFNLTDDPRREYSIEIDPRTVSRETLALLKGLGFNRLSLGIQDFDPAVQKAINRTQTYLQIQELMSAARRYGFNSISFDLIYGLPHQTPISMKQTLEQVIALAPDRISFYNYAHLPHLFSSQRAIDRLTIPSADEKLAIHRLAVETLCDAGYELIGMDHFVHPDDELCRARKEGFLQRNFQGYSTALAHDLLGLGVSAISMIDGHYAQNAKEIDRYQEIIMAGELACLRGYTMTPEDHLRHDVIMTLACQLSLHFAEIEKKHQIDFAQHFQAELNAIKPLEQDGLIQCDAQGIRVTSLGRLMLRNICMIFDEHLGRLDHTKPSYSKTL